jgi:hypothetical protein
MGRLYWFSLGACITVVGCAASASFPYRYYVLQADKYEGKLLADKPANDLSLAVCAPEAGKQAKCLVMLKDAYLQLRADYLSLQTQLSDCQRGK